MSNYYEGCRIDPDRADGPDVCPFTTLHWEFLMWHEMTLRRNTRMSLQLQRLSRLGAGERRSMRRLADPMRAA